MDVARLQVVIEANTSAVEAGFARTNTLLEQMGQRAGTSSTSFGHLTGAFALGTVAANAFMGAMGAISNGMVGAGEATLKLSSNLEQARIGFGTMLGSAGKADSMIAQIQQKAESSAFTFPGLLQGSQRMLGMGIAAEKIIPTLTDISAVLSAVGAGGNQQSLERITLAFGQIQAKAKLTGEEIRQLANDNVPVLAILTEGLHKSGAEIMKMSEAGEITSDIFFKLFHDYTTLHFGDIEAAQARTWAVASSNLGDILGRLSVEALSPLFDAATKTALAFTDLLHTEAATQWAANIKQTATEVIAALAPAADMISKIMGIPAGAAPAAKLGPVLGPSPSEVTKAMATTIPAEAVTSAAQYKAQMDAIDIRVHSITASINALSADQAKLKFQIDDIKAGYEATLQGLHDKQAGLNLQIEATKAKYEAILAPLEAQSRALTRLNEDTKAEFAKITEPLQAGLQQTTRSIQDAKAGYESFSRPIQSQIDGIEKANSALQKQLNTENQLADLKLRQRVLDASGDPNARADIAAKLLLNQYARDDLANQQDLAEATSKKGLSEKATADFKNQQNRLDAEHARLELQSRGLIDRGAMADIERQRVLNDATKERGAILQGNANIETQAKVDPLQKQLDDAKKTLQSVLDPLELMQASLTRAIQDVATTETAAMKPIIAAQAELARKIQDTTQAQADALKPMEDQQKNIAAQIAATEARQRDELAPLLAKEVHLGRVAAQLEIEKKWWEDQKTAIHDAADEAEAFQKKVAEIVSQPTVKSGDTPADFNVLPDGLEGPVLPKPIGVSLIPAETIANINEFAQSLANLNAQIKAFNDSGSMTTLTNTALLLGTVLVGARIAATLAGIGLGFAGIITWAGQVVEGWGMITGAAASLGAALGLTGVLALGIGGLIAIGVALQTGWETNFGGIKDMVTGKLKELEDLLGPFGAAFFDVFGIMLLAWSGNWKLAFDAIKGHWDTWSSALAPQMATWRLDWTAFWIKTWADWDRDWAKLKTAPELAWNAFTAWFKPAIDPVASWIQTIATAFQGIGDAIRNLPTALPAWWSERPGWLGGTGGANATGGAGINLPGGHGGGNVDLTAGNPGQNQIGLSGQDAATACGPYAALLFYNSIGRFPTAEEAIDLARQAGWTQGAGMGGMWNFVKMLGLEGISGNIDTTPTADESRAALRGGSPLAFSTPRHYFAATGIDAQDRYHVGGTGTALQGGSEWMTLEEMTALGGGMQGVITMSQQMGDAVELAKNRAAAGLDAIMNPMRATGVGMAQSLADGLSAGNPVVADAVNRIAEAAIKNGLDPRVLLAIAQQESGLDPTKIGDSGHSVGLFQLSDTSQGAGMSVAARQDAQTNIDKFLSPENIAIIKQLMAGGMSGRALAVEAGRLTERPKYGNDPNSAASQSYGVQYDAITKLTAGQNAATAGTQRLGAAQQQATDWAKVFADQQAHLALIMQQQVPAGMLSAADSMRLFGSVLGPIERQIAGGEIGVGTLEFKLLDLARATGLNTDAWAKFSSGAIDSTAAMSQLIDSTAALGPEFAAVAAYQRTAGSDTVEASLRWFQAAKNYGLAKAELAKAPALPATPAAAGVAAPAVKDALNTAPIKAVGAAWDETKDKADAAGLSVTAYQDIVNALDVDKITEQTDAWNTGTDAIRSVSSAADDLIGTLNKATDAAHDLAKALNDLPSGSGVGSHAAGGFWPQGQASWVGEHGPEIAVPTSDMWVVPNSQLPRGVPAGSGGGGGHVVNINGPFLVNTQAKNAAELAPALRDELAKIARNNGGPDRLFR